MDQIRFQEEGRNNRQQKQIEAGQEKTDVWRQEKGLDREANKNNADARNKAIQERRAQQDAMREQRDFEAFDKIVGTVNSNLTPEQEKEYQSLKPEERKTWWKNHVGRGDQNNQQQQPLTDEERSDFNLYLEVIKEKHPEVYNELMKRSEEERIKEWREIRKQREEEERREKTGAPKNGDRKQFKQGWGTWKDGKWVLDAQ